MSSKETVLYNLGKRDRFAPFAIHYVLLNNKLTVDPQKKISYLLKAIKLLQRNNIYVCIRPLIPSAGHETCYVVDLPAVKYLCTQR
jgi:hypothetical protein